MRMARTLVLCWLILVAQPFCHGEIMVGESIEWLVDSSESIGHYKVTKAEPGEKGKTWVYTDVQCTLASGLKGAGPENTQFQHYAQGTAKEPPKAPREGSEFLVFFSPKKEQPSVRYHISLSAPAVRGFRSVAFTKDARVLKSKEEILETVAERIKLDRSVDVPSPGKSANVFTPPGNGCLRVEIPADSEAFRALYSGSVCYLVVPADKEFRDQLLQQLKSKNVWTRAKAARRLAAYPGADTEKILRPLLQDPGKATLITHDEDKTEIPVEVYPVRQAAYEALKQLGVEVKKPEGTEKEAPRSFLY